MRTRAEHLPCLDQVGYAADRKGTKVAVGEQLRRQPSRARSDDDLTRLGKGLHSRGVRRRLAKHLAIRVGDHETAGDAGTDSQPCRQRPFSLRRSLDQSERRMQRPSVACSCATG